MDDPILPPEGGELPLRGPHWGHQAGEDSSSPFVPLKLVLYPGSLSVELTRPDMIAGRHTEADITLRLPDVSRRHCRFVFTDGRWQVFDLQSLNGLFVNNERVEHAVLEHRDSIRIGSYTFEVDLRPGQPTVQLPGKGGHPERFLGSISDALPQPLPEADKDKLAS